jgi:hypothetical protein
MCLGLGSMALSAAAGPGARVLLPAQASIRRAILPVTDVDRDGNRIDDELDARLRNAREAILGTGQAGGNVAASLGDLASPVDVEFNFVRPVTQREIDAFTALGGRVTWVYRAVGYGWNGSIALGSLQAAVASMGAGFNGAVLSRPARLGMYTATRNGRVRQQWPLGYAGNANITIGIIDTGVSSSGNPVGVGYHPDLAGRMAYWHDYSPDAWPTPRDKGEHGSHVTGIATGSGSVGGINPSTIKYSDSDNLIPQLQYFIRTNLELPALSESTGPATFDWSANAKWIPGNSAQQVNLFYAAYQSSDLPTTTANDTGAYGLTANYISKAATFSTSSALSFSGGITLPFTAHYGSAAPSGADVNTNLFSNYLGPWAGTGWTSTMPYSVATTLSPRNGYVFSAGDSFPLLSGVAPACKWAGFKVFADASVAGSAPGAVEAAMDDLAAKASTYCIKVANMSMGSLTPLQTDRDKANAMVDAGVFVAVAAMNEGPTGTFGDPARAGKVMTVAASNSDNQLTLYTSDGFTGGTDVGGDTIKPDIMAPGGSRFHTQILSVDSNDSDAMSGTFPDLRLNDYRPILGTSMATPFVAGCAALVIDAWQQNGHVWQFGKSDDPLFVKMLLCATATESNMQREVDPEVGGPGVSNPTLGRAANPKDGAEGYGLINVDAAIECLRRTPFVTGPVSDSLLSGRFEKRASGFNVYLTAGASRTFTLAVPAGADFDLYLYRPTPDANGNPIILASSTTSSVAGNTERITFTPTSTAVYYLVVKRVSGGGTFTLTGSAPPPAPAATTSPATSISALGATLNGTVNPRGYSGTAVFNYGLTTAYGTLTNAVSFSASTSTLTVSKALSTLASGTTYHYRLEATTIGGPAYGGDQVFTTKFAIGDVLTALRVWGGLAPADPATVARLNVENTGASTTALDLGDAARLARKVAGRDPNP